MILRGDTGVSRVAGLFLEIYGHSGVRSAGPLPLRWNAPNEGRVPEGREHLGPADKAIIQARKLLREAVKAVEAGKQPAGTGTSYYTVKAGEDVFARDADWHRALAPDITRDKILQTV